MCAHLLFVLKMIIHSQTWQKCSLCGLGESELCSPLVVAQSRAEHDAALETHSQINDRAPLCKLSGRILNAIKGYSGSSSVQSVGKS
jgi:hypothetical protein